MLKIPSKVRPDLKNKAHIAGFNILETDSVQYWDESHFYQFDAKKIEEDIQIPTEELHCMFVEAAKVVVNNDNLMKKLKIPEKHWEYVKKSLESEDPSIYGRMDFSYDGKGHAKLLEYNADTPVCFFETASFQWHWLRDMVESRSLGVEPDQLNTLFERMAARYEKIAIKRQDEGKSTFLHLAYSRDFEEDKLAVEYMGDIAESVGISTKVFALEDIGVNEEGHFVDDEDYLIKWCFKLYPWELMFRDEFSDYLEVSDTEFIEPAWKSIISNKAMLPIMWEMYPYHPNLLETFSEDDFDTKKTIGASYVKKPIFSREGENVTIFDGDQNVLASTKGVYGEEGYIYQRAALLPNFSGRYPMIGSFLADNYSCGMMVREDDGLITKGFSRFIPHILT